MSRASSRLILAGLLVSFSLTLGCGGGNTKKPADKPSDKPAKGTTASSNGTAETDANDEVKQTLAKLSDEDRASAEKQKICPVSDEPLGSMGAPIKETVAGKDVWICCAGCKEKLHAEPEKYLAKIK